MAPLHRTVLFVPGVDTRRIHRALTSPADAVAIDLEDAVAPDLKDSARESTIAAIQAAGAEVAVMVRVNPVGSRWFAADIRALAPVVSRLSAVILPKVNRPADVRGLVDALSAIEQTAGVSKGATGIVATIETARGVLRASRIAAGSRRVSRLLFGSVDLSAELGVEMTAEGREVLYARSRVVLASAAAGLSAPLDGPYIALDDSDGLWRSTQTARSLGFGGKVIIHPKQLATVDETFRPTPEEIAWARDVDAAYRNAEERGLAAIRLANGQFVDVPVALRARRLLEDLHVASSGPDLPLEGLSR